LEGARRILNLRDASELEPATSSESWIFSDDPVFGEDNISLAGLPSGTKIDSNVEVYGVETESSSHILAQRGEEGDEPLWYYFVGWEPLDTYDTESLQLGKVVGVYNSSRHGRAAVEIGVKKLF